MMSEKPELTFESLSKHRPALIEQLLTESYADIPGTEQDRQKYQRQWRRADRDAFESPETIGRCTFITCLNAEPIGMGSFDPRQGPAAGIIGQNCILPAYRGRGFGKRQVEEILRRMQSLGIRKAVVTTGNHSFFLPAQKMYLACGFREARRFEQEQDRQFPAIEYHREL